MTNFTLLMPDPPGEDIVVPDDVEVDDVEVPEPVLTPPPPPGSSGGWEEDRW